MPSKGDPYLDAGMHGYIRKTAMKEFWRVSAWYDDVSDLIQDGYLCFAKCRARYVDKLKVLPATDPTPDDKRQMMAMVRTAFDRHVKFVLTQHIKDGWEVPVSQLARAGAPESADPWDALAPAQLGDASVVDLLRSLPAEIQQLMVALMGDVAVGYSYLERRKTAKGGTRVVRRKSGVRETTNQYYCRLIGVDPATHDLVGQIRSLLHT
jgi:hypothetical protein